MENAISVTGLVKTFGQTRALDGLDLTSAPGEVHGFLGPNGAGKSTTIRVLLGLLRADAGTRPAARRRPVARRRRAAPPARLRARRRHPVAEPDRRRGHRPARPAARRPRPSAAATSCSSGSSSTRRKKGRAYSKGNRQKVALVAALASDVELLLLDEPTSGLDPLMEEVFRAVRRRGARRAAAPCCCPATSSPRSRRSATGSRIIRAGPHRRDRHPRRAAPPDPHLDRRPSWPAPPHGPGRRCPASTTCGVDGDRVRFDVDTAALDAVLRRLTDARRAQPGQPAADAGGAVPAALRATEPPATRRVGPMTGAPARWSGWRCAGTGSCCRSGCCVHRALLPVGYAASVRRALPDRGRARRRTRRPSPATRRSWPCYGPVFGDQPRRAHRLADRRAGCILIVA